MDHECPKCGVFLVKLPAEKTNAYFCVQCKIEHQFDSSSVDSKKNNSPQEVCPPSLTGSPLSHSQSSSSTAGISWKAGLILFLVGLSGAIAGAWFWAGTTVWIVVVAILGFACLAVFRDCCQHLSSDQPSQLLGTSLSGSFLILLALLVLDAVWLSIGLGYRIGEVFIDNFSSQHLLVQLDGESWVEVAPGSTTQETLRKGRHEIVVRSQDGVELDRLRVTVKGSDKHVLNLLGAQGYYQGSIDYQSKNEIPKEIHWTWINADVDFLFQEPPARIEVTGAKARTSETVGSTKTYLLRNSPPRILN